MNVPERIEEFKKRIKDVVQREVDLLYEDTRLIVKDVEVPCEIMDVSTHLKRGYRIKVERVNARIDI